MLHIAQNIHSREWIEYRECRLRDGFHSKFGESLSHFIFKAFARRNSSLSVDFELVLVSWERFKFDEFYDIFINEPSSTIHSMSVLDRNLSSEKFRNVCNS